MKTLKLLSLLILTLYFEVTNLAAQSFENVNVDKGLCNSVVKCFAQDEDGFMWMGTFDGLCRYDGYKFTTYRNIAKDKTSLWGNHVEALLALSGKLLVGTDSGLDEMSLSTRKFRHVLLPGDKHRYIVKIKNVNEKVFVIDSDGEMFFAEANKMKFSRYRKGVDERMHDIAVVDSKRLLLLSNKYLYLVNAQKLSVISKVEVKGLPASWNTLYYSKNLRLAIVSSGIGFYSKGFEVMKSGAVRQANIKLPADVKNVCDYEHLTVFATDGHGLLVMDGNSKAVKQLVPNNHFALHSLFVDSANNLWIGTYRSGFDVYSVGFELFKHYNMQSHHLTQNVVTAISVDDKFIYAGIDGGGLNIINRSTGQTKAFTTANSGIPGNNVVSLAKGNGCIFLGIYGKGVSRFDLRSETFSAVELPKQKLDVLWELSRLDRNHIKVRGLFVSIIDSQTGKLITSRKATNKDMVNEQLSKMSGLPAFKDNTLRSFVSDHYGNLWIGTDNGLFCQQHSSKAFLRFGANDNLPSIQFCKNASAANGSDLFFGTTNGIVVVKTANMMKLKYPNKVFFDGISVINEDSVIAVYGYKPAAVRLCHDQNFISINVAVPEYVFPGRIKLRYKLEGIDKEWQVAENVRNMSYTNLPHGNYTFRICTIDATGKWTDNYSSLDVCILPPWYLTWWAKTLWLILTLLVAYYLLKTWHNKQKLKYEIAQKEKEKELERKANEDKMNFFAGVTHELRTPMFLITAPLEELLESERRPVQVPYSYLKNMYQSALRLNKLINSIIDIKKLQDGSMKLHLQRRDFVKTCNRLIVNFRALCLQKNISFKFITTIPHLTTYVDIEKIELMLSNLITNAYKYTPSGGEVSLTLKRDETTMIIEVADNGVGMSAEKQLHIFEPYYRGDTDKNKEGSGIGLFFVMQLVKVYGGNIDVVSSENNGSRFTLRLPIISSGCSDSDELAIDDKEENGVNDVNDEAILASVLEMNYAKDTDVRTVANPMALRTLLIVDDEDSLLAMLEQNLSKYYNVILAHNGYEGISLTSKYLPDAIVSDMMMPGMDGIEFVEKVKADKKLVHIPVIMLTAKSLDEDRIKALKGGAEAYLTKPVSLKVLRTQIDVLLNKNTNSLWGSHSPLLNAGNDEAIPTKKTMNKENEMFILRCKELIDAHLEDQSIDVETLAHLMNMSQSTLYKRIKTITGGSVADLILDYKIFKATTLFKAGMTSVTDVAYKCGFNSIHSFRTSFKQRVGMSPTQYIKEM